MHYTNLHYFTDFTPVAFFTIKLNSYQYIFTNDDGGGGGDDGDDDDKA